MLNSSSHGVRDVLKGLLYLNVNIVLIMLHEYMHISIEVYLLEYIHFIIN